MMRTARHIQIAFVMGLLFLSPLGAIGLAVQSEEIRMHWDDRTPIALRVSYR